MCLTLRIVPGRRRALQTGHWVWASGPGRGDLVVLVIFFSSGSKSFLFQNTLQVVQRAFAKHDFDRRFNKHVVPFMSPVCDCWLGAREHLVVSESTFVCVRVCVCLPSFNPVV